jgi:hypothetical protein
MSFKPHTLVSEMVGYHGVESCLSLYDDILNDLGLSHFNDAWNNFILFRRQTDPNLCSHTSPWWTFNIRLTNLTFRTRTRTRTWWRGKKVECNCLPVFVLPVDGFRETGTTSIRISSNFVPRKYVMWRSSCHSNTYSIDCICEGTISKLTDAKKKVLPVVSPLPLKNVLGDKDSFLHLHVHVCLNVYKTKCCRGQLWHTRW